MRYDDLYQENPPPRSYSRAARKGSGTMICSIKTLGISGIYGSLVSAESYVSNGMPGFDVVGLPDADGSR